MKNCLKNFKQHRYLIIISSAKIKVLDESFCHIYLVFFFCGEPIPLWPGGLAYRAVRLRREQRRWQTVNTVRKEMRPVSCWNFLNPCLTVIMWLRGGIQIEAAREKQRDNQGEKRRSTWYILELASKHFFDFSRDGSHMFITTCIWLSQ